MCLWILAFMVGLLGLTLVGHGVADLFTLATLMAFAVSLAAVRNAPAERWRTVLDGLLAIAPFGLFVAVGLLLRQSFGTGVGVVFGLLVWGSAAYVAYGVRLALAGADGRDR